MFRILLLLFILVSAAPENAFAGFDEGHKAYSDKNWAEAIFHLRPLAEKGDARAMVLLGNMYVEGLGVSRDPKEAFSLYYRAAVRNNTDAMVMVGALYQRGLGAPKNPRYAAEWFGRAARLGHSTGALFYAMHLFRGNKNDNPKFAFAADHDASYKWFRIAAKNTRNKKISDSAEKLARNVAAKLSREKIVSLNEEVKAWVAEKPDALGPAPEDVPVEKTPETPVPAIEPPKP